MKVGDYLTERRVAALGSKYTFLNSKPQFETKITFCLTFKEIALKSLEYFEIPNGIVNGLPWK